MSELIEEKKPLRLAFTGEAGHGKSTSTDYILSKIPGIELTFAGPLKKMISHVFMFNEDEEKHLYNPLLKTVVLPAYGTSCRILAQKIGTEVMREDLLRHIPNLKLLGPTVWIHNMAKRLIINNDKNIVVSDDRFPDEYEFLKSKKFTIVKILDPRKLSVDQVKHASEQGSPYDMLILNDGTLEQLYEKLSDLLILKRIL